MTITIFGASGQVGRQLITHALAAGHKVKAFGRNVEDMLDRDFKDPNFSVIKGYVFDKSEVHPAIKGSDAVLSALGGSVDGNDKTRSLGMKNIVDEMVATGCKRIVAVGGLGALQPDHGEYMVKQPDYPKQFVAVGLEHVAAYEALKAANLDFTFVCPPDLINKDADGNYIAVAEELPPNWEVYTGNLALFMVREVTDNNYVQQRVGLSNQ